MAKHFIRNDLSADFSQNLNHCDENVLFELLISEVVVLLAFILLLLILRNIFFKGIRFFISDSFRIQIDSYNNNFHNNNKKG